MIRPVQVPRAVYVLNAVGVAWIVAAVVVGIWVWPHDDNVLMADRFLVAVLVAICLVGATAALAGAAVIAGHRHQ